MKSLNTEGASECSTVTQLSYEKRGLSRQAETGAASFRQSPGQTDTRPGAVLWLLTPHREPENRPGPLRVLVCPLQPTRGPVKVRTGVLAWEPAPPGVTPADVAEGAWLGLRTKESSSLTLGFHAG